MASWCKIILLVVLAGLLHRAAAECLDQSQSCDECYDTLAKSLVNMRNNKYNLRRVFYPLGKPPPVFVTVTYQYNDSSVPNQTWYWGAGVFYFFQPLEVFQFTSLFFGNADWRSSDLTLTLSAECVSAPEGFMTRLTEQLKLYASQLIPNPKIDTTYKGKGFNLITLKRDLYTDVTFYGADHPELLYCFQFLFPFLVIILVVMYCCCWLMKKYDQDDWVEDPDSWAITVVHTILSSTFIVYVIALDIAAVVFRDHTPAYYSESYNGLLFHYPGFLLWWDIIALIIIAVLIFIALAAKQATDCDKYTFLVLKLAVVVPLLSLASHAQYIIIAWITDPLHATGIGINYAIFYVIHLVVLKQSCKRTRQCYDAFPEYLKVYCIPIVVLPTVAVWFVSLSLQVLVTAFFVYIPINHSIEETPSTLLTIIQGITVLFVGLIAWKVIVDPRGKGALAIISGALRKAIKKKDPNRGINSDTEWVRFDDEEKLAEVLHHVIKIN